MTRQDQGEAAPSFTRKRKLIDPRWQLGVACVVSMLLLGTGALYMLGAKLISTKRVVAVVGEDLHQLVATAFDVAFFLGVVALVHHVVVAMTHVVVGPAFVVERGLKQMQDGRRDARFSLREGDYLNPVASAASVLQENLIEQAELVDQEIGHLRVAAGDHPDVRASLERLERAFRRPGKDDERGTEADDDSRQGDAGSQAQAA